MDDNREKDYNTETKICIPVVIKRKIVGKITRAVLSAFGSGCIVAFSALMAVDPITTPNWCLLLLLLVGTITPAVSWLISSED